METDTITLFITFAIVGMVTSLIIQYFSDSSRKNKKKQHKFKKGNIPDDASKPRLKILYGTQSGKCKRFCLELGRRAQNLDLKFDLCDVTNYEPDDQLANDAASNSILIVIISTYTDGTPPDDAKWFYQWLEEASHDFRVGKSLLQGLNYAVFGCGNSLYESNYNKIARNVDGFLHKLSATRCFPLGEGDENVVKSIHGSQELDFDAWANDVLSVIAGLLKGANRICDVPDDAPTMGTRDSGADCTESSSSDNEESDEMVDVEDIGAKMASMTMSSPTNGKVMKKRKKREVKEMVTPALRQALTKQGYKLIGTHSGVKLCRWTKSMLRGRGGCYKHTFYGIESHRCMETTPSLACANKCVFCWRHHTNPVGTEWKWKMDEPEMIVEGAIANHYSLIKQFKGVPGVKPERFAEGFSIKHCALSLVGEPIMYPKINEFIGMLHSKGISSFLVTNAQFPDAIKNLEPVTQLYVSVDAATPESLKKIDRPLFKDYWPRFVDSLKALSEKGQRTVYRLTLVKAWNAEEIAAYADLVEHGKPDFIEVKGVTYCGDTSTAGGLTMKNVPWHEEVLHFVQQLTDAIPEYEVACEHEHSNCVLIANTKFKVDNSWCTWIDYGKFHSLHQRHSANGENFTAMDYMAPTPSWAVIGSKERGFDPTETRWRRKSKPQAGC